MTAIDDVAERLHVCAAALPSSQQHRRAFVDTYRRTTLAVGAAVDDGRFEDPEWVTAWDVVFAEIFLRAFEAEQEGGRVPRPWRLAFDAPRQLPALVHVLLGINAHVNYDLPQALLAVSSDDDFDDDVLMARRERDHARIDGVLASRVAAEDAELGGRRRLVDRLLTPLNRAGSKRFLREARQKVWHNTYELHDARVAGPEVYGARLAELEVLAAARIAELLRPGLVLLRLAVAGFGVRLPPAG